MDLTKQLFVFSPIFRGVRIKQMSSIGATGVSMTMLALLMAVNVLLKSLLLETCANVPCLDLSLVQREFHSDVFTLNNCQL